MASPLIQAAISACFLTATSNIAAQFITAYRNDAPYTINWVPVFQFVLYTALNSPPNFLWQQFLEATFPSHTHPLPTPSALHAAATNNDSELDKEESSNTITEPSKLNLRHTAMKFVLDQTVGAALNTLAFSLAMGAFQGLDYAGAMQKARREFWPLVRAGWRLWPWVSLVNFALVRSVQGRALVGSVAGVVWGIYLSLVAGGR